MNEKSKAFFKKNWYIVVTFAGGITTSIYLCYAIAYTMADKTALWLGVFITVLVEVGMELIDKIHSKFSIGDLIADGVGDCTGCLDFHDLKRKI